jgi:hypothetical protein
MGETRKIAAILAADLAKSLRRAMAIWAAESISPRG